MLTHDQALKDLADYSKQIDQLKRDNQAIMEINNGLRDAMLTIMEINNGLRDATLKMKDIINATFK